MNGIIYKEHSIKLDTGDGLLLYTDGVTEACCGNELYGNSRLLSVVNSKNYSSCKEGIEAIKESIDSFAEGTEQSDDITMLWVKYEKRA